MKDSLKRLDGENYCQYVWRLDEAIRRGECRNWNEAATIANKELYGEDFDEYRNEATYRKDVASARKFFEAGVFNKYQNENDYLDELRSQKQETQKERQKLSDERVELNRLIRQEARKESYADMVKSIICQNVEPKEIRYVNRPIISSRDELVHITDIHAGIEIDNWANKFNGDVLQLRLQKYLSDIINIRNLHNCQNCYVVVGEILSGIIHSNLRLQNNMDLMEQFKFVSELLATFFEKMSEHFDTVYVYTTPGNHSRITPKKEDALDGENMDILLPFYLKARLQNYESIVIVENTIDPEIAMFSIRGKKVFAAHGHKDTSANVVQNFTMMFGMKPDIVLLGHRHLNGMETVFNTKVIQSGCVSGSDQYCLGIRKTNRPEQTVSIIDENGLVCLYDIQLD